MFDWQPEALKELELTWGTGLAGLLVAAVTLMVSSAAALAFLVKLPATYFRDPPPPALGPDRHPVWRWVARIGKNLLGVLAALAGILLSLPGIPGPGFVLLLIGVMLLDFPGKCWLERRMVEKPGISAAINWLRQRFGKPPLAVGREALPQSRDPAKVEM